MPVDLDDVDDWPDVPERLTGEFVDGAAGLSGGPIGCLAQPTSLPLTRAASMACCWNMVNSCAGGACLLALAEEPLPGCHCRRVTGAIDRWHIFLCLHVSQQFVGAGYRIASRLVVNVSVCVASFSSGADTYCEGPSGSLCIACQPVFRRYRRDAWAPKARRLKPTRCSSSTLRPGLCEPVARVLVENLTVPEVVPPGLGQPGKVSRFSPMLLDHFDRLSVTDGWPGTGAATPGWPARAPTVRDYGPVAARRAA